jgi:hypothetical protein
MSEPNSSNKKKGKSPQKKKSKISTNSLTNNLQATQTPSLSENVKNNPNLVEQLLAQALLRYKNDYINDKKTKFKEFAHLASLTEEYMSCFALIGYSLENEKVVVFNTPTSKDEAALVDLLRSTFIEIVSNRP